MELKVIILIIILHFISDFLLQINWMSKNKSSSVLALFVHCFVYSILFLFVGVIYAIINGILHFIIDYFSSKLTSKYWYEEKYRLFFIVIGIDQTLHFICLFSTYVLIFC